MATLDRSSQRTGSAGWRESRPFWGGALLILGSLLIAWVPWQFATELAFIGGPFTMVGLVFAVIVFLLGTFAIIRPDLSTIIGATGVAFSILSLIGSLGGLLFGTILGIAGGALCIAWKPPEGHQRREAETSSIGSTGQSDWQRGAATDEAAQTGPEAGSDWQQSMGSVTDEAERTTETAGTGDWESDETETGTFDWQEDTGASTGTTDAPDWEEETTTGADATETVTDQDADEESSWDDSGDDDPTFSWQKDPYGQEKDDT